MTDHAQVGDGGGADLVLVGECFHADFHGQLGELAAEIAQGGDEFGERLVGAVLLDEGLHQRAEFLQPGAVVHQHLASEQVERLDGVGAFVDHVDAGVAHVLLHAPLGDVAVAAVDLHRLRGGDPAVVGDERLDDGREQGHQVGRLLAHAFVGMMQFAVDLQRDEGGEGAAALGVGLGRQQHAAHVRMHDDRVGRQVRRFHAGEAAHLQPLFRVDQRVLIGNLGLAQPLHTHAQARRIHHHEHRVQALVRLPHEPAGGRVQVQLAGRVAVDAHFLLDRTAGDAIARADAAIGRGNELGHDEQRNSPGAGRSVRQAREHQVHDVGRHVVLAGGDEYLAAGNLVGPVGLRLGLGAQQAQVGAAMRLGQAHGAGPFARHQLGQVQLLLLRRAVLVQAFVGAVRQTGVHVPGLIAGVQHFGKRVVENDRQSLTAVLRVAGERRPARFHELLVRLLEAFGRGHGMRGLVQVAALAVARVVQGEQHLRGELGALLQHLIDGVGIDLRILRDLFQFVLDPQQLVQHELHVAQGSDVLTHGVLL